MAPGMLSELHASMFDGPSEVQERGSLLVYRDSPRRPHLVVRRGRDADIEDPSVWLGTNPASWLRDGWYLAQGYACLNARGALLERLDRHGRSSPTTPPL
jgi:hypothetical protein